MLQTFDRNDRRVATYRSPFASKLILTAVGLLSLFVVNSLFAQSPGPVANRPVGAARPPVEDRQVEERQGLEEFFSAEMKALLEGTARPSRGSTRPNRTTSPGSSAAPATPSPMDAAISNSSNPLRSSTGGPGRQRLSNGGSGTMDAPRSPAPPSAIPLGSSQAPPRLLPGTRDARPMVRHNQEPQSLLDTGSIGLLSNETQDPIELPPPYSTTDAVEPNQAPRRIPRRLPPQSADDTRLNRPLAEAITSPNLPIQMGFDVDELDLEEPRGPSNKNRLSPADLEALAKQLQPNRPGQSKGSSSRPSEKSVVSDGVSDRPAPTISPPTNSVARDRRTVTAPGQPPTPELQLDRVVYSRLFEFAKLRQQLGGPVSPDGSSSVESDVLNEVTYWIWRGDFHRARARIETMDSNPSTGTDVWEVAWLNAEVAIGMRDPVLLEQAESQLQQLRSLAGTSPSGDSLVSVYAHYLSAHRSLLQSKPDLVAAVADFRQVLEKAAPKVSNATPWARQRLLWLLLNSQLEIARCVALGPYRSATASADQWFQQSRTTVEELIQAQLADPLLRVKVVLKQVECLAETARFSEIQPLVSYLATQEHQLQGQNQADDARWVRQQATKAVLKSGLMAYNHQQITWAENWLQQAKSRLNVGVPSDRDSASPAEDRAIASWLEGAIQLHAGKTDAAVKAFELTLQHRPPDSQSDSPAAGLEWGERMAIMAVAFWGQDRQELARQLNQRAIELIQDAIEVGLATGERIETPLANLAAMSPSAEAELATGLDLDLGESAITLGLEDEESVAEATDQVALHLGEIREQLESPVVTNGLAENTPLNSPAVNPPAPTATNLRVDPSRNQPASPSRTTKSAKKRPPSRATIR